VVNQAGDQAVINYSVFAGIAVGLVTAWLFDRYHNIQLPPYLGFFGCRRFGPIVTSLACLIMGFALSYFYPIFNTGLTGVGAFIGGTGVIGAFVYGFINRLLIPIGLHHIVNTYIWFIYGDYTTAAGNVVTGELTRFAAGDPAAGLLTSGFYPILMFGLPAAALAMIHVAKPKQKKVAVGILSAAGLTAFITGVTEPLEFAFMFVAFPLYLVHAVLTGLAVDRLSAGHPPGLFVLGRPDRPAAVGHRARRAQRVAADRDGPGLRRRLLRAVPVRHHPVEHADPGPRPGAGRHDGGRGVAGGLGRAGRGVHRRVRRPGQPDRRRRLHHPPAGPGDRRREGRQGAADRAGRGRGAGRR